MITYQIISENGGLPNNPYIDSQIQLSIGDKIVLDGNHYKVVDMKKYLNINVVEVIVRR